MIPSGDPLRGIISHRGDAGVLIRFTVSWSVEANTYIHDDDEDDVEVTARRQVIAMARIVPPNRSTRPVR